MPVAPSDPAQVGGWWDGPVDFNGLDSSGLLCHSMESESLQHIPNNPPNGTFDKGNSNEHNIQQLHQGGCVMVPSSNNERFHNLNPWPIFPDRHSAGNAIPQELERAMMYRHSPVSGHQEFALEPQHMPAFYDSFRSGTDVPDQPPPFLTPFTAADLGTLSQPQNADDTASLAYSQASCNSKCTSSVCENENCSVTGTPCDDPTCVENICAPVPVITNFRTQVASGLTTFRQLHGQPCNHTESEHLVARTLGELRAPAESDDREKSPYATKFDYTLVSRAGDQFYDGIYQPSPSPAQLTSEAECSVSNNMQTPLQPISSLPITPNGASHPERHICQWITNTDTHQGFPETCGAEFSNAKDFHDHLCTFHIDKLTSQTGFACLWAGCPREQCQPFVTRGKLRRHILTHSVCT
ncbi:hypothetical protein NUW58_g6671 [Xylaria curta]|uniref:Uncharacterized protein n=1 Tax=Xylaria curta TaxID=42375 RepID=A0ACC1NRS4_9PEZI|nr:hypothetical protein NUW58_g6671 [Xylaria curta]